jgi:hypothetical protein
MDELWEWSPADMTEGCPQWALYRFPLTQPNYRGTLAWVPAQTLRIPFSKNLLVSNERYYKEKLD